MIDPRIYQTFKKGSTTFFLTSRFFPPSVRDDVFIFYAFVRKADDYVDSIPAQLTAFANFKNKYYQALEGVASGDIIIDSFVELINKRGIPVEWIDSFLEVMTSDTRHQPYDTLAELSEYIYGSAEVIGLVMAKLLNLPSESYESAQLLGRAFQYINFIRDIAEDITLGRRYLPREVIRPFGFEEVSEKTALAKPIEFKALIKSELDRYRAWQHRGEAGFGFIPKRCLVPIKTAADMYAYTAAVIEKDPLIIFKRKVKPGKARIIASLLANIV